MLKAGFGYTETAFLIVLSGCSKTYTVVLERMDSLQVKDLLFLNLGKLRIKAYLLSFCCFAIKNYESKY